MLSKLCRGLIKNNQGATAVEYGLIAALIALVVVGGATLAGGSVQDLFTHGDVATIFADAGK